MNYKTRRHFTHLFEQECQQHQDFESNIIHQSNYCKRPDPNPHDQIIPCLNITNEIAQDAQQDYIPELQNAEPSQSDIIEKYAHDLEVRLTDEGKVCEPCTEMTSVIEETLGLTSSDESTSTSDSLCYPKSFDSLIRDDKFLEKINISVDISVGEILLMTLKYALHNKSSVSALISLLRLINCIFKQSITFDTKYMLDKTFNPKNNAEFHAICPACKIYVGQLDDLTASLTCECCNETMDLSSPSCDNFFVTMDPSDAIEYLLNAHIEYYDCLVKDGVNENGIIRDIYNGRCYRKFVDELPTEEKYSYLTAIFNTDGANRFKSSRNSIWPIYLMVNELPSQVRLNNLITCAVYFDKEKAEMTNYLYPFVGQMNRLSTEGIQCNINGSLRTFKLYAIASVVDAVARAPMQGLKQFNGHYGCNWCLQPGGFVGGSMRYPMIVPAPTERTKENMLEFLNFIVNENTDSANGVIYGTQLFYLKNFDIVRGFLVDPMHCVAGVAEQITKILLGTLIEEQINLMNIVLEKIQVPTKLGRLTRSIV